MRKCIGKKGELLKSYSFYPIGKVMTSVLVCCSITLLSSDKSSLTLWSAYRLQNKCITLLQTHFFDMNGKKIVGTCALRGHPCWLWNFVFYNILQLLMSYLKWLYSWNQIKNNSHIWPHESIFCHSLKFNKIWTIKTSILIFLTN